MGTWTPPNSQLTEEAAADLSASQFMIVKKNGSTGVVLAASAEKCIGVLQNKPVSGQPALVFNGGQGKILYGGTVNDGDLITSDAASKGIATTTVNDYVVGQANGDWVAGDIGEINLCLPHRYSNA